METNYETKYEKINGHLVTFVKYEGKWLADAYEVAIAYDLGILDADMYLDVEHIEGYYTVKYIDDGEEFEGEVELIGTDGINDMKRGRRINDRVGVKNMLPVGRDNQNYILESILNKLEELSK